MPGHMGTRLFVAVGVDVVPDTMAAQSQVESLSAGCGSTAHPKPSSLCRPDGSPRAAVARPIGKGMSSSGSATALVDAEAIFPATT
jgi:hypothetical protein